MNAAVAVDPGFPTLSEELDRKTFETLDWLVSGVDRGLLTEAQFVTGIDALFMAVSGLVADRSFVRLIGEAQAERAGVKTVLKRHFHAPSDDEVLTFAWTPGEDRITTTKRVCGMAVSGKVFDYVDAAAAAKRFKDIGEVMDRKGWIEL